MKPASLHRIQTTATADSQTLSLPSWIYRDAEFFEREKQAVFRNSWQVVCHLSDIPQPGAFHTFEFFGVSVVAVRAEDGGVRAFHYVCRHRAARLLDGPRGHCGKRITCGYHAWTYALDGRLIGVPNRDSFKGLDTSRHGLATLEHEVFCGFIFVRFEPGLPSVREMAAPYLHELTPYRMEELVPLGRVTLRPRAVNWKNVADNFSDGLHINVAHPGLTRLFGRGYGIEARPWIDKMSGALRDTPSANWSERAYQRFLPPSSICRRSGSGCGLTSSSGPTSPSTSTRTRSISCSSCRYPRPRRWCARSPTSIRIPAGKCVRRATSTGASIVA